MRNIKKLNGRQIDGDTRDTPGEVVEAEIENFQVWEMKQGHGNRAGEEIGGEIEDSELFQASNGVW